MNAPARRRVATGIAAVALAAGLAGCASLPPPPPLAATGADQAQPPRTWSGRFAVEGEPDVPPASGRFVLERLGARQRLDLVGPLGQTLARVDVGPDGAWLMTADGRTDTAPDADGLLERALGWRLPVGRLAEWLDGRLGAVAERDESGRPLLAIDDQWRVRIDPPRRWWLDWPADAAALPPGARDRRMHVRLVLDP